MAAVISVLLIEDNPEIVEVIRLNLASQGFQVAYALDGAEGLAKARSENFDIVILDLMLPSIDGMEICRKLREGGNDTPLLMLTSRSDEVSKVLGLEIGADDYLTKPFSVAELSARVKALLRRSLGKSSSGDNDACITFNGIEIQPTRRKVYINGTLVELSRREFDLLEFLASTPGRVFSRAELLSGAWGSEFNGYEHTVSAHVNRLRQKIEPDLKNPRFVETVWGVGYRFCAAQAAKN